MEIIFRKLTAGDAPRPAPGEIQVFPADARCGGRRALAAGILQRGLAAVRAGDGGRIERLVVPHNPTLDDMLAAAIAERIVNGEKLPTGLDRFARYAELVREGLRPTGVPLVESLEAVYLAIRTTSGDDLLDPENATRFCEGWSRLWSRILQAAEAGEDPFARPIFTADANFVRERTFLARDREVYGHDLARGDRWLVAVPGGPPAGSALLLRQPRSILWKYWSRSDETSPTGDGYLFLAVLENPGQWVFSVDPVHRLSLQPLADRLQQAEAALRAGGSATDPWFDGKPFQHTLIAAPHAGTRLPENGVLQIVRRWTCARRPAGNRRRWGGMAAMLTLLAVAVALIWWPRGSDSNRLATTARGLPRLDPPPRPTPQRVQGDLYYLAVGVSKYQDPAFDLNYAAQDAGALAEAIRQHAGPFFAKVEGQVLQDEQADRGRILSSLRALVQGRTAYDFVVVTLAGHGLREKDEFFFLPHDFARDPDGELLSRAVRWEDLWYYLQDVPGVVLVLVDTCHSGTIADAATRGGESEWLKRSVDQAVQRYSQAGRGLVVLASSMGHQQALEKVAWGHGALTLAVLEAMNDKRMFIPKQGTPLPSEADADRILNLGELEFYVSKRVAELTDGRQAVIPVRKGQVDGGSISLAVYPDQHPGPPQAAP